MQPTGVIVALATAAVVLTSCGEGQTIAGTPVSASDSHGHGATPAPSSSGRPATPATKITGPEGTSTVPAKESPITEDQLADPCAIPHERLRAARLDPGTEVRDAGSSTPPPDARMCFWNTLAGAPFSAAVVYVLRNSYQELGTLPNRDRFVPTRVGDREATQYRMVGDVDDFCSIMWGTSTGALQIQVQAPHPALRPWTDPCLHIQGVADALFPALPR